jgi:DNA-binding SARP family transcriptional activator
MPGLAKLTRPKLHGVVRRERVCSHLSDACTRPLVWVSGPPGAGKTVAVASFLESSAIRSIWFQIDSGDNDLSSFFYYLSLGAEPFRSKRMAPLPLLTPEYLADVPGYVRHFFRILFERMKTPAALVVDDYHLLQPDNPLHGFLEQALNQAPDGINVIIAGRSDPPPQCARIEASDKLSRLDFDALRLDLLEAQEIAAKRYAVAAQTLEQLHAHCGGWIAGFTLMLERLKHAGGQVEVARFEARAAMFDYFASQIFHRSDAQLQDFLLRTALFPHMSATMAQTVSRNPEAPALLDHLYRGRLFTERRGDVYRYHDLFRAFLQERLNRDLSQADLIDLRRRAAEALENAGQIEEAFRLRCEAKDWEAATRLVLQRAPVLLAQGRSSLLRDWIGFIPAEIAEPDPWISYWFGMSLLEISPHRARDLLQRAYDQMKARDDFDGLTLAASAFALSFISDLASLRALDPWIDRLTEMLDRRPRVSSPVIEAQACAALLFALTYRRPDHDRLEALERRTLEILSADMPSGIRLATAQALLMYYSLAWRLEAGTSLLAWVSSNVDLNRETPLSHSMFLIWVGYFHFACGEIDLSNQECARASDIADSNAIAVPVVQVVSLAGRATNEALFGDIDVARSLLDGAIARLDRILAPLHSVVVHAEYVIACGRKTWAAALQHAQLALSQSEAGGWVWGQVFSHGACGLALSELGRHAEATEHLIAAHALVAGTALYRWRGMLRLSEAHLAMRRGDMEECTKALKEGFGWMRGDGARLPVQLPGGSPPLLAVALAAGIETEFVRDMIRRFRIHPPSEFPANWPWPIEIRTLGSFEILCHGKRLQFERKIPKRALELLQVLIAFGGRDVAQERIADALWPDSSGDEGINALNTTISRLRKLLDQPDALTQAGGRLTLNQDQCFVDAFVFEKLADASVGPESESQTLQMQQALDLYRGSFLDHEQDASWAVSMRERLRRKFALAVGRQAQVHELSGDMEAAKRLYLRGIDADELAEEFYRGLMRCYKGLGRRAEAMSIFRQLRQALSVTLGIGPSKESQLLFESLRNE